MHNNKQDEIEVFMLGEIDFEGSSLNEAQGPINFKSGGGECKIFIYGSEGRIPHFHIKGMNNDFECCIKICKAEYFDHGYKTDHLSKKDLEKLDEFLNKKNKKFPEKTNWEVALAFWNSAENEGQAPENCKKPVYANIGDSSGEDEEKSNENKKNKKGKKKKGLKESHWLSESLNN